MYKANSQTIEMQSFGIEGNIIDHSWYSIVKKYTPKGSRTDSNAIILLSDIVYWYKPSYQKDEDSGELSIGKKFKSDLLQRSYAEIENHFGMTKDQARSAFETLEFHGIIERVFRTITINNVQVPNIMYIKFNNIKLQELMKEYYSELAELKKRMTSSEKTDDVIGKNRQRSGKKPTYTETSTESSSKNDDDGMKPSVSRIKILFLSGKELDLSKEDLYAFSITSKANWSSEEIEYLYGRLKTYADSRISDLKKLCFKILSNRSKADRAEKYAGKEKSKEKSRPSHESIPAKPSENLKSFGDVLKEKNKL